MPNGAGAAHVLQQVAEGAVIGLGDTFYVCFRHLHLAPIGHVAQEAGLGVLVRCGQLVEVKAAPEGMALPAQMGPELSLAAGGGQHVHLAATEPLHRLLQEALQPVVERLPPSELLGSSRALRRRRTAVVQVIEDEEQVAGVDQFRGKADRGEQPVVLVVHQQRVPFLHQLSGQFADLPRFAHPAGAAQQHPPGSFQCLAQLCGDIAARLPHLVVQFVVRQGVGAFAEERGQHFVRLADDGEGKVRWARRRYAFASQFCPQFSQILRERHPASSDYGDGPQRGQCLRRQGLARPAVVDVVNRWWNENDQQGD